MRNRLVACIEATGDRMYWRLAMAVFGVRVIEGIRFVDVRDPQTDRIAELVGDALRTVRASGRPFDSLVQEELAFIAVLGVPRGQVKPHIRAYVSPFRGHERWNSHYLARASNVALDLEREFMRMLPDPERWLAYLESNRRGFPPATAPPSHEE